MTALFLLALAATQGTDATAAPSAIDLRPWQLESASAIASTAWPASGAFLVDATVATPDAPAKPEATGPGADDMVHQSMRRLCSIE